MLTILLEPIFIQLREGKKYVGILRSYDQYGNMVLQNCVERLYYLPDLKLLPNVSIPYPFYWSEEPLGLMVIRGETMLLYGSPIQVESPHSYEQYMPAEDLRAMLKEKSDAIRDLESRKRKMRREMGILEAEIMADLVI